MTERTTAVVASYTLSLVRSNLAVGVGSSFFTTTVLSSDELNGVLERRSLPGAWAPSVDSVSDRSDRLATIESLFLC